MSLSLSLCLCLSHAVSGCPGRLVTWHLVLSCGLLGFVVGQLHKQTGKPRTCLGRRGGHAMHGKSVRRACDAWHT